MATLCGINPSRSEIGACHRSPVLESLDMQTKLPLKSGCASFPLSPPEERFSGRVYIYCESSLSASENRSLSAGYGKSNLLLDVRGLTYFDLLRRKRDSLNSDKQFVSELERVRPAIVQVATTRSTTHSGQLPIAAGGWTARESGLTRFLRNLARRLPWKSRLSRFSRGACHR